MLKGGIYTGEVTEFHGPPGSGKSQVFFLLCILLKLSEKVTLIFKKL